MQDASTTRPPAPFTSARCPVDGAEMGIGVAPRTPQVQAGSVPLGFQPATVMLCQDTDLSEPRPAEDPLHHVDEGSSGQRRPASSAAAPDQSLQDEDRGTCSLEFTPLPYLLLLNQQRQAIRVAIPVDACSKIRGDVHQARTMTNS